MYQIPKGKKLKLQEWYRRWLIEHDMAETQQDLIRNIKENNFKKLTKRLKLK